jgi:hypothetical protein
MRGVQTLGIVAAFDECSYIIQQFLNDVLPGCLTFWSYSDFDGSSVVVEDGVNVRHQIIQILEVRRRPEM